MPSKKKASKKPAAGPTLPENWEKTFHEVVHARLAAGFTEPQASEYARAALREFKYTLKLTE